MEGIQQLYNIYLDHPKVITDSRCVEQGCIFFALRGDHFNGNQFASKAIEAGAAYAVIDEIEYQKGDRYILVDDVLKTLQALASFHRSQFHIPVIGITGSNGKTTTKELVSLVLSSQYKAHFTKGNYNNHIGVPLSLLAMPLDTEVAIIEIGANHVGEIRFLSEIAKPTHGLITNIGKAHLEGFGGIEGVKKGKSELYRYLEKTGGVLFINADELYLTELAGNAKRKVFYQKGDEPCSDCLPFKVQLKSIQPYVKVKFAADKGEIITVESHLVGSYNFYNIMTAVVLGIYFKVPSDKIKAAIENYVPVNNRSQIIELNSNTFIMDAYNANPSSMRNVLMHFSNMDAKNKIAILGSMLELGEYSEKEHTEILDIALSNGLTEVVLVGKEFKEPALEAGVKYFDNTEKLAEWFNKQRFANTYFLVKGSRSIGLEKMLEFQREK